MSLQQRFALLAVLIVAPVIIGLGVAVDLVVKNRTTDDVDVTLNEQTKTLSHTMLALGIPGSTFSDPLGYFVLTHGTDGSVVSRTSGIATADVPISTDQWATAVADDHDSITVDRAGGPYRVHLVGVSTLLRPGTAAGESLDRALAQPVDAVAVGASLRNQREFLQRLTVTLFVGVAVALVVAAGAGWMLAGRAVRPMSRLAAEVDAAWRGGASGRRVSAQRTPAEVGSLSTAFNTLLDRVEATFGELEAAAERQKRFVADASHELRTPLTTIRTDLEGLKRHRWITSEEREGVLNEAVREVERLTRLVSDLLALAMGDTGTLVRPHAVDWDALVATLAEDARRICSPRAIQLRVAEHLDTGGADAGSLRRALGAVFENVAHHTPPDTSVWLTARDVDGAIEIVVDDDGPGVAPAALPHLFDRFTQADPSRHTTGTGLGLAIARTIVEAHGGVVTAQLRDAGGLRIVVRIPRGEAPTTAGTAGDRPSGVPETRAETECVPKFADAGDQS